VRSLVAFGLVAAVLAAAPTVAHAKPKLVLSDDLPASDVCPRGKTWPIVQRCLDKVYRRTKARVEVAFGNDKLKVVSATTSADDRHLIVYAQLDTEWFRTTVALRSSSAWEVLAIEAFPSAHGEGVRIDVGTSSRTGFVIAPGAVVRGIVRRRISHVCVPGELACRSLQSGCEAYAHGKVYWLFRGEPVWHPKHGLRMRGDARLGGVTCRPIKVHLLEADE
jgi:hypothetical protein